MAFLDSKTESCMNFGLRFFFSLVKFCWGSERHEHHEQKSTAACQQVDLIILYSLCVTVYCMPMVFFVCLFKAVFNKYQQQKEEERKKEKIYSLFHSTDWYIFNIRYTLIGKLNFWRATYNFKKKLRGK